MRQVGSYDAKTHLSKLLDRVAAGERITITRHGVPVAVLMPISARTKRPVADTVAELKRLRQGRTLGGASVEELVREGRR